MHLKNWSCLTAAVMHLNFMAHVSLTVSIEAQRRLRQRKEPGESYSDVILREIPERLETAGKILDYFEAHAVPKANPKRRAAMLSGRGRRSNRHQKTNDR